MEMSIDKHIGVIEDLKSTMSVCMPEPEKTEICTSLGEAIETMRKYQKIKEIISKWDGLCNVEVLGMLSTIIDEVLEDGNE